MSAFPSCTDSTASRSVAALSRTSIVILPSDSVVTRSAKSTSWSPPGEPGVAAASAVSVIGGLAPPALVGVSPPQPTAASSAPSVILTAV